MDQPRKVEISNRGYPVETKVKAVEMWLKLGNLYQVSDATQVSLNVIKNWKAQTWWKEIEEEILLGRKVQVNGKLTNIVDKALETVEDRLENGDVIYDIKTGELRRKPVALRDATQAAVAMLQRQEMIEKAQRQVGDGSTTKTIQEQLTILAQEFAKFNNRSKSNAQDIAYKELPNAIHEEWETRLQDGSQEVYESPIGSQEEN